MKFKGIEYVPARVGDFNPCDGCDLQDECGFVDCPNGEDNIWKEVEPDSFQGEGI